MYGKFRTFPLLVIALLFAALFTFHSPAAPATASPSNWSVLCIGVANNDSERGLWFDTAGGGVNDESALFWFINNSGSDENCTATSSINPAVSTNTYPKLRVRAAVNDTARFKIQVFRQASAGEFCDILVATINWADDQDHSGFLTKELTLPANTDICEIRVKLDDFSNAANTGRTNALIADLRIWDGSAIGWRESFAANP